MTRNERQPMSAPRSSHEQITVTVPGSASNLGGGFDCVGMAIGRLLTVTAQRDAPGAGVRIQRDGTLAALDCDYSGDLIWRGFVAACGLLGQAPPADLRIRAMSGIPVARGLGSSAAAIVAGVLLANGVLSGNLDDAAVIDLAASLEGHPDNVAPSVLGGAVLSVRSNRYSYYCARIAVNEALRFVFAVPDFEVRTSVARAALPEHVEFETAVGAAAHAAALVTGLATGDAALLAAGLNDFLHVPFRRALVRGYDSVTDAAIEAGAIGATLSGSGSSIIALVRDADGAAAADAMRQAWASAGVESETFITAAGMRGASLRTTQDAG